ncbi:NAD(P)-dependent oxidoreductase [Oleiharenicola lentus]|uniref:NAD(P)-dependent oxidoreductase n=1 Tax=Oleiharenicola lentus TaxID=2508720 RepID=A0A4Q1CAW9_9BACT|nr:NAD(P)-dependent oxidoreductase [Oleiharenicola lentus]RXK56247.1 NAD(P)-dependent oxidoreductase [Oleiharenicola lentus]
MPELPSTDHEIELLLSTPTAGAIEAVRNLPGDFMVLGVGGKMGTSTAVMLRRALDAAGRGEAVVTGVSRFSRPEARAGLENLGVRTLPCDLADAAQVAALPLATNVLYLAGQKFGTDSAPGLTWIQNTYVPALVAQHFRNSRIVVFSTGCVYPFVPVTGPGAHEGEPVAFLGEYASTCVGRERVFAHFAQEFGTRQLMYRLNYAVELRYGVLVDIALKVARGEPVDLTMGWLNCIWQGDACARAIQCLVHTANPPKLLNITGAEKLSVRSLAGEFGRRFGRPPHFTGTEAPTAWLSDARESLKLFGPPETSLPRMLDLIAAHVGGGGRLLGKPTHFEARSGKF